MAGNSGRPLEAEVHGSKTTWKWLLSTTNELERGSKALYGIAAPGKDFNSACGDPKQESDNSS